MTRKFAIIIPDGFADYPLASLGGRTPMQAARTPAMDRVAAEGVVGSACFVPPSLPPGSDVANLGVLGYDPVKCYSGRAPLEAAAQGIELGPHDWAVRCNMVTVEDGRMRSFAAGHITTAESASLLATLQESLDVDRFELRPGVSYRNLLICRGSDAAPVPLSSDTYVTPPHDLADQIIADAWPRGPGCELLCRLMDLSVEVFRNHPVNDARRNRGQLPATNIWLWGMGRRPAIPPFQQVYGRSGAMITGVDLLRGIGRLLGWKIVEVPGATGYFDTDYAAKGRHAIATLRQQDIDLVCVHVEAPDEAGHDGNIQAKIAALEAIDRDIVAPIFEWLQAHGDYRLLITPDHPTPVEVKTHTRDAVPWTLAGTGIKADANRRYDEPTGAASGVSFAEGWKLMEYLLG